MVRGRALRAFVVVPLYAFGWAGLIPLLADGWKAPNARRKNLDNHAQKKC